MSGQITGKVVIRVDGEVLPTENQATLTPDGVTRNAERHGGKTYFSEEETAPMLECNILITKNVDVKALSNIIGATVLFEADTGQQYVMRQAFTTEVVSHNGSGKTAMKMSSDTVEKI